jgi:hypothetical protein
MRRFYRRRVNSLCMKGVNDPVGDVCRVSRIADMLELAPTTVREMATGRDDMVRAVLYRASGEQSITWRSQRRVATVRCYALPARGNAEDPVGVAHNVAGRR